MISRPGRIAIFISIAFAALLASGCANVVPVPYATTLVAADRTTTGAQSCDGLNALSDLEAAARLDIAELTLRQLRERANVDNEGACKLPAEARNKIMRRTAIRFAIRIARPFARRPKSGYEPGIWMSSDGHRVQRTSFGPKQTAKH